MISYIKYPCLDKQGKVAGSPWDKESRRLSSNDFIFSITEHL